MPNEISPEMREYFREMGRKGGAAGKGTAKRHERARHAAIIRWRREHPTPKKISIDSRYASVTDGE